MFASKFVFFAALLALFNAVIAVAPGCLIGAINTQKDPLDFKNICANKDVQREIVKMCPEGTVKDALKSFSDSCAEAGQKVSLIDISKPNGSPGGSNGGGDDDGDDDNGNGSGANPTTSSPGSSPTDESAGYVHNANSFTVAAVVAFVGLVSTM
ncbi:uncharacterized protein BDCG_00413 [Blastomyces dermatitidis ER-3]|uniref:GPI anchored cell wall protein n=2 Tax=Blastomyces TaxID=229219 RepID=A0A179UND8_BLAGS|nr:uncharacterized protein BDBG_04865 [Blastomyces gilchristii SLH14081]XP_045271760.1 uncharacterized protein BDCG_00413 [Blastomyces dermatitidis ER-3]EEQ83608.1 hypothetical protein BDCG_00413 [Blastomyces dermatitidis ER-3]OAT08607.1 hypothetical protein BDBG_04865 [Blastomyces gilchristii SLH14081]